MDGEADVVFADEFFNPRKSCRSRVTGDYDGNARAFAVLESAANVGGFVFFEIDGSGGVRLDACGGVVRERGGLLLRIRREMIFHVFEIYFGHMELLQEAD